MLDIKRFEKNEDFDGKPFAEAYKQDLKNRGDEPQKVDKLLELNQRRKQLISEFESARSEQNRVGQEIAQKKKAKEDASSLLEEMKGLSARLKEMEAAKDRATEAVNEILHGLPNKFHSTVPVGASEEDNVVVRTWGEKKDFKFQVKDHADLGESLDIIDFERATRVTGARFAFMKKSGSHLERGLIQFMMDLHTQEHNYVEMIPPFIVNSQSMFGTGQFPKFKEDVFHLSETDYYLIPTAETSVTNYYTGEILSEDDLPQSFCAYSPCFRSEAGSHGKDTKGIFRQHQFNKVELLHFSHPDNSYEIHEQLVSHAEKVLQLLELPYQVVNKCTADMTFSAAKCYDLEVWLPSQKTYREISSCSNFEDFQARRANIRFRPEGPKAKPRFVHTLNGSGVAVGRTVIAILENYQNEDGTVDIPKKLQPYLGGLKKIKKPQ